MRVLIEQQWAKDCDQWKECRRGGGNKTKSKAIQYVPLTENTLSQERDEEKKEPCSEERNSRSSNQGQTSKIDIFAGL
jgi:hypothetical protein